MPSRIQDEWAVTLQIPYMYPGKLNVYVNEKFMPATGSGAKVIASKVSGANYKHPVSKELFLRVGSGDKVKIVT